MLPSLEFLIMKSTSVIRSTAKQRLLRTKTNAKSTVPKVSGYGSKILTKLLSTKPLGNLFVRFARVNAEETDLVMLVNTVVSFTAPTAVLSIIS